MTQTLLPRNITIRDLIDQFGLQLVRDRAFFPEWRENLAELTEQEKQTLDIVQAGFLNLDEGNQLYSVLQIMKRLGQF